jgi:hypothetical protein
MVFVPPLAIEKSRNQGVLLTPLRNLRSAFRSDNSDRFLFFVIKPLKFVYRYVQVQLLNIYHSGIDFPKFPEKIKQEKRYTVLFQLLNITSEPTDQKSCSSKR